jgi:hypothetical protein
MRMSDRKVSTKGLSKEPEVLAQPTEWRQLWTRHVQSCKRREVENSISISQFRALCEQRCSYCNAEPLVRGWVNAEANGVDRINSNKGYTLENVIPACFTCNRMKTGLSIREFVDHVKLIKFPSLKFPLEDQPPKPKHQLKRPPSGKDWILPEGYTLDAWLAEFHSKKKV